MAVRDDLSYLLFKPIKFLTLHYASLKYIYIRTDILVPYAITPSRLHFKIGIINYLYVVKQTSNSKIFTYVVFNRFFGNQRISRKCNNCSPVLN